jgi:hypothetical protein
VGLSKWKKWRRSAPPSLQPLALVEVFATTALLLAALLFLSLPLAVLIGLTALLAALTATLIALLLTTLLPRTLTALILLTVSLILSGLLAFIVLLSHATLLLLTGVSHVKTTRLASPFRPQSCFVAIVNAAARLAALKEQLIADISCTVTR